MIHIDETDPVGDIDPAFPYRDVSIKRGSDPKQYYDVIEEIGRGKFGTVYKVREKSTGFHLAAKFIPILKRGDRRNVEMEIEMMNSLQHPKIIQLYDAYEYCKMMCVVLELVEGGELFDRVLDENFIMTDRVCGIFVRQICEAMEYIHQQNILHLDLKPENILCLSREGNRIKIIDFGLARRYDPETKLQILFGTPEFVAPEVVNFESISFATDMWSVGVIAYVLVSGLSPFAGETDVETMGNVTIGKYDFLDEAFDTVSPEAIDFITKLLEKDQSLRMTAGEALKHKWVKKRPQYYPTKSKTASNEFKFKPVSIDFKSTSPDTQKENLKNSRERWNEQTSPYMFDTNNRIISPVNATDGVLSNKSSTFDNTSNILATKDDATITPKTETTTPSGVIRDIKIEQPKPSLIDKEEPPQPPKEKVKEIPVLKTPTVPTEVVPEAVTVPSPQPPPPPPPVVERIVEIKLLDRDEKKRRLLSKFASIHDDEEDTTEHMFVKGIPRSNEPSRLVRSIVTRFNSTESSGITSTTTTTMTTTSAGGFDSRQTLKFATKNIFGKTFQNDDDDNDEEVVMRSGVPWAVTNRRIKFRISSLSRDVPIDMPDHHKGFIVDAPRIKEGKNAESLFHFLEKCSIKNQN